MPKPKNEEEKMSDQMPEEAAPEGATGEDVGAPESMPSEPMPTGGDVPEGEELPVGVPPEGATGETGGIELTPTEIPALEGMSKGESITLMIDDVTPDGIYMLSVQEQ